MGADLDLVLTGGVENPNPSISPGSVPP